MMKMFRIVFVGIVVVVSLQELKVTRCAKRENLISASLPK